MTCFANQTARLLRYKDCIMTQPQRPGLSFLSRYNTLNCDTHSQPGRVSVCCRSCHGLPWPCCGLYCGPVGRIVVYPLRSGQSVVLPCVTIQKLYRDSNWEKGNSPFQLPATFFFLFFSSFLFFFSHSSYWKTIKKKLYIYFSFSSKSNKFIKIYFIFFSSFTHCKTLEKISSHNFFFF